VTVTPGRIFAPGIVKITVVPRAPLPGENAGLFGIVGAGLLTVKERVPVDFPAEFVTTRDHVPAVTSARLIEQVI